MPALKINTKIQIADILRHIILSWLLAVLIEYLTLPSELRDLAELDPFVSDLETTPTITGRDVSHKIRNF